MDGTVVLARLHKCAPNPSRASLGLLLNQVQNGISIGSTVLAHLIAESSYTLQWAAPSSPLKIAPSRWGCEPVCKTWFLGPTRELNPKIISIGSAVFAALL